MALREVLYADWRFGNIIHWSTIPDSPHCRKSDFAQNARGKVSSKIYPYPPHFSLTMADTTGPGVADDGQSPETLRALRNAAEGQTAEDSWPGASAGNNQSVEASGTNQSVEASTEERASLASAAEAEAARATVNAWLANGNQVNARRYSLFTRENQILESIFALRLPWLQRRASENSTRTWRKHPTYPRCVIRA